MGAETQCAQVNCDGACCMPDGSCQMLTASQCSAQGGSYLGTGQPCPRSSDGGCPAPGACCLANGGCEQLAEQACNENAGLWIGANQDCSAALCTPHWSNPAGGAWQLADNWDPQRVPRENDLAIFDLQNDYPPYAISISDDTLKSVIVREGGYEFSGGTITLTAGDGPALVFGDAAESQQMRVWNGGFRGVAAGMSIGAHPAASAILRLDAGGWMEFRGTPDTRVEVAPTAGGEVDVVVEPGGSLSASILDVGAGGTGTVLAKQGARLSARALEVHGGGRITAQSADAQIGGAAVSEPPAVVAEETLLVENGGVFEAAHVWIDRATDAPATPVVEVRGRNGSQAAMLSTDGALVVARHRSGNLRIAAGGAVARAGAMFPEIHSLSAAEAPGSSARIDVLGAQSSLHCEEAWIAPGGNATVDIRDGGLVSTLALALAESADAKASVTVAGADSDGSSARLLTDIARVGVRGTASIDVGTGGVLGFSILRIAEESTSVGSVTVGTGGRIESLGEYYVSEGGIGALRVENGGAVVPTGQSAGGNGIAIASNGSGAGTVVVTGVGPDGTPSRLGFDDQSILKVSGPESGRGVLEVLDGGEASFGWGRIGLDAGVPTGGGVAATVRVSSARLAFTSTTAAADFGWTDLVQNVALAVADEGVVLVQDGGRIDARTVVLGSTDFGQAEVFISGANSLVKLESLYFIKDWGSVVEVRQSGALETGYIDVSGRGRLRVIDGGLVTSTVSRIGIPFLMELLLHEGANPADADFTNAGVVVAGAGSTWRAGTLTIGNSLGAPGYGTLEIDAGGRVECDHVTVERTGRIVGSGGVLAAGTRVVNGGFIAPGLSPGLLTIEGDYEQTRDGTLEIEVSGSEPGQYDVLTVTGNAQLAGKLELRFIDGFKPSSDLSVPFLKVGGTLAGAFNNIVATQDGELTDAVFETALDETGQLRVRSTAPDQAARELAGPDLCGTGACGATASAMLALTLAGLMKSRKSRTNAACLQSRRHSAMQDFSD